MTRFDDILQVDPIREYHRVITMETFVEKLKDDIWPRGQQTFFCHSRRNSNKSSSCDALNGEPFNTFWTSFSINEDNANYYSPLTTASYHSKSWQEKYPSDRWPVIAFVGAPSPFPTHRESIHIQKFLRFSHKVAEQARIFQQQRQFFNQPYVAIHLRHGNDWEKACDLLKNKGGMTQLFSSTQCTGYENRVTPLDYNICMPSPDEIVQSLKNVLLTREMAEKISTVYVATDRDDLKLWDYIIKNIPYINLITPSAKYTTDKGWTNYGQLSEKPTHILDAFLLSQADQFIGNCVSSFSAFAARIRVEQMNLTQNTHYFGWKLPQTNKGKLLSDEL